VIEEELEELEEVEEIECKFDETLGYDENSQYDEEFA
jgi:hypothetical protein